MLTFVCCLANDIKCTILSICFSSKVDQIQDIVTGNPTVVKMVVSFNRGARGHNTLRQLLAPVVKDIIEDKNLGINTNPVDVYKAWVNQLETATGEARYGENTVCQNIMDSDGLVKGLLDVVQWSVVCRFKLAPGE